MIFCMITTFFGPHSFGGDAAYVDRVSRALARRGHRVHVIHCKDAFEICRAGRAPRPYEPPPGVTIHALSSPFGPLSPLATQQTGQPWFKIQAIRRLLEEIQPDVVHYHNISLIGGPGLLTEPVGSAIKLMTAHEYWLVCPLTVLWKPKGELCQTQECIRCSVRSKRPPQLWRLGSLMQEGLDSLDALICPSFSTQREHSRRGMTKPTFRLPYFLPEDYQGKPPEPTLYHDRPYLAMAGRLEDYKGFQDAIQAMSHFPWLDLRIAGVGPYEAELRHLAQNHPNVQFEGPLDSAQVAALFRGAQAVVVPSLVYETFGYVVLEAFAEKVPVIVRELGALPELVDESQGGLTFDSQEGLVEAIGKLAQDRELRDEFGLNGWNAWKTIWSESQHLEQYLGLIHKLQRQKRRSSLEPKPRSTGIHPARNQPSQSRSVRNET